MRSTYNGVWGTQLGDQKDDNDSERRREGRDMAARPQHGPELPGSVSRRSHHAMRRHNGQEK